MNLSTSGWIVFAIFEIGVLLGAWYANADHMLTPWQMINVKGFAKGIPFVAHMGMLGDLILISPLCAKIWNMYHNQWSWKEMAVAVFIGLLVSALMHKLVFVKTTLPESHTYNHNLTKAGLVHLYYFGIAIAFLILFYFRTKGVNPEFAKWVTIALSVHIFFGTHCVLGMWNPSWYGFQPMKTFQTWATLIPTWSLLYVGYRVVVSRV